MPMAQDGGLECTGGLGELNGGGVSRFLDPKWCVPEL
jgi:hypothetical protein